MDEAFINTDYEDAYCEIRESEEKAKRALLNYSEIYQADQISESIEVILEMARKKRPQNET